ncbi:LysR family transcriptional regulator [Brevibacillus brevis]|uniref:LysR family transcriptional regulator n=1 Tax=Brevibacillus brevis TaxID=1393 RepID=UPI000D0FEDF4|nr:LysR family transcriptional regulator [Brevibacillus brevis]PSJ68700.1 LysR family transcriptional regulator [Brevibacillus brevis]RED33130.1 DNA-binding transcriptional LysR family regulator [Brevibacillus brevis]GEC93301.1 LysR family transcriptional regulator [Brevibacillus brevis]VEF90800.1 Hca operon transcriptional activator [Brevibacillus brevis]
MLNFEWYRSFISVYKCGSVSEAAKLRNMLQPEISQHLSFLEAEVGQPLFIRTTRKMLPTERSKMLFSQIAPLIESLEETAVTLKTTASFGIGTIRIGATNELFSNCLLPRFSKLEIGIISYFGTVDQLFELLMENKLDIITTSKKFSYSEIDYLKLTDEEFVIVAPKHYEIIDTTDLNTIEYWLISQDWISYSFDLPIIKMIWREHFKKYPLIKPIHILPNLDVILTAIENGMGLSVLPKYLLEKSLKDNKSKIIFEDLSVKRESFIAYKSINRQILESTLNIFS